MDPVTPDYSPLSLVIIAVAVLKDYFGSPCPLLYNRNSDNFIKIGFRCTWMPHLHCFLTAALIFIFTKLALKHISVGVVIFMYYCASIELLQAPLKKLLVYASSLLFQHLFATLVKEDPDAEGVYDLIIHSYGPDKFVGSSHTEVPGHWEAIEIDTMNMSEYRDLQADIRQNKFATLLVAYASEKTPIIAL